MIKNEQSMRKVWGCFCCHYYW
uniref:Uncharacterized protein n=1 Tax=Tetranychus urticae TaxID=32264 RepID=T1KE19_TETUR